MYVFSPLHQTNRVIKKGGELRGQIHANTTGKNGKEYSSHVPAIIFIG